MVLYNMGTMAICKMQFQVTHSIVRVPWIKKAGARSLKLHFVEGHFQSGHPSS